MEDADHPSPRASKRQRIDESHSDFRSSANAELASSSSSAEPQNSQQSSNLPPIDSIELVTSANLASTTEGVIPSASRLTSVKRRHPEQSSEAPEDADLPSFKGAKRQRLDEPNGSSPPVDAPNSTGAANTEVPELQADTPSSTQVLNVQAETASSTPASDAPSYPTYIPAPDSDLESKPKWTEPALAPGLEEQLRKTGRRQSGLPFFTKLEYNMEEDKDNNLYDVLGDDRKLLRNSIPTRGRGRGRGRGGRGRGGRVPNGDRQEPSEVPVTVMGRGRGGYRVKKSGDPRIQALYHRRAALRNQYKAVANFQRAALEAYAEKSAAILLKDPVAHMKLPAYDTTTAKLGSVFEELSRITTARYKYMSEFLVRRKEQDEEYERRLHYVSLEFPFICKSVSNV